MYRWEQDEFRIHCVKILLLIIPKQFAKKHYNKWSRLKKDIFHTVPHLLLTLKWSAGFLWPWTLHSLHCHPLPSESETRSQHSTLLVEWPNSHDPQGHHFLPVNHRKNSHSNFRHIQTNINPSLEYMRYWALTQTFKDRKLVKRIADSDLNGNYKLNDPNRILLTFVMMLARVLRESSLCCVFVLLHRWNNSSSE